MYFDAATYLQFSVSCLVLAVVLIFWVAPPLRQGRRSQNLWGRFWTLIGLLAFVAALIFALMSYGAKSKHIDVPNGKYQVMVQAPHPDGSTDYDLRQMVNGELTLQEQVVTTNNNLPTQFCAINYRVVPCEP